MSLTNDRRHDGGPSLTRLNTAIFRSRTAALSFRLSERAVRRLYEGLSNDYRDVICAPMRQEIEARRNALVRKYRLKWPHNRRQPRKPATDSDMQGRRPPDARREAGRSDP